METITKPELVDLLKNPTPNFFILDVRELYEYEAGHIPTAIYAPWENIIKRTSGIPKDTNLILYCRTGIRAVKAVKMLEQSGYTNIKVYVGGFEDWTN
jgi:rhodanese-related sulfurtransferase